MVAVVHIEKRIKAPVSKVYKAFQEERALRVWYDPRSRLSEFKIGGKLTGDNYPSAGILALITNQMVVHRYGDVVSGTGIWSFVPKSNGRCTLVLLDHLDASEDRDERVSISFYWRGLIENLAAFCEGRELPFDHDLGDYKLGKKPRSGKS